MAFVLRYMKSTQVIEDSFRLYFKNFGYLLIIALAFQAIPVAAFAFFYSNLFEVAISTSGDVSDMFQNLGLFGSVMGGSLVIYLIFLLEFLFLIAWTSKKYLGENFLEKSPLLVMWASLGRGILLMLLIFVIYFGLMLGVGLITFLLGFAGSRTGGTANMSIIMFPLMIAVFVAVVIFMLAWSFSMVAVVIEGCKPVEALRRSWQLTKGERGKIFGTYFILYMAMYMLMGFITLIVFLAGGSSAMSAIAANPARAIDFVSGISTVSMAVFALLLPLGIFPLVLLYFSARVKKEDFNLEQISAQWDELSETEA